MLAFLAWLPKKEYLQRLVPERRDRRLKSDFLIVQISGGVNWRSFRDVFEVDGDPVRDRDERLVRLFLEPPSDSLLRRASEIADASIRYNFPGIGGLNDPLIALKCVQDIYRTRFRWTLVGNDRRVGPNVWSLRFDEHERPTILKLDAKGHLPASGQIWIDDPTGRIMKTNFAWSEA